MRCDDGRNGGLLTRSLLAACEALPSDFTYKQLYERIAAAYAGSGKPQHVQAEGEIERELFGGVVRPTPWTLRVLRSEGSLVLIDGGSVHGLCRGAKILVQKGEGEETGRQAQAELIEVRTTESLAKLSVDRGDPVEVRLVAGSPVVVCDPGTPEQRLAVGLGDAGGDEVGCAVLTEVGEELGRLGSPFLRATESGERPAIEVVVRDGRFRLLDAEGAVLFADGELSAAAAEAPRLAARLVHLARYRNVERLRNDAEHSALEGRVEVELGLLPDGFDVTRDQPRPTPLPRVEGVYQVRVGQWVCLTLRNRSRLDLHLALLNLRPDGSICQLLPGATSGQYQLLQTEQGEKRPLHLPIQPELPSGFTVGRDVLKVFACIHPTSFRALTLPAFDQPTTRSLARPPLEDVLARGDDVSSDWTLRAPSGDDWTTVQVETWMTR